MIVCGTKRETRAAVLKARESGQTVGLVPTLGALHGGHMSLVRRSVADNDLTVVSIFLNPTQFGPNEDLEKYPRTFEEDRDKCEKAGADIIFAPDRGEMYAEDCSTRVEETSLSKGLCGAGRPTHFRGVTTVVTKLLNIVQPDRAYFGQKDGQQAAVIKRMTRDLDIPVEIVVMPTVREADGLAKSSRNTYLKGELRREALVLSHALEQAGTLLSGGERDSAALKAAMERTIATAPHSRIDYIEIVDAETLEAIETVDRPAMAALAVFIGETRLIDNRLLNAGEEGKGTCGE
ncbi:MAG: pantoate--beta-alanine ligase [Planctomycetota bacterium]